MNTRITFDIKNYNEVCDIITEAGGVREDFITDDCVELGDDESYIETVKTKLNAAGISFKSI